MTEPPDAIAAPPWFDRARFARTWAALIPQPPLPLTLLDYPTIDSTNRALGEALAAGWVQPPAAAIARQQTAGRGQWNRTWQSAPGGLYLSLALPGTAAPLPLLTLAIAYHLARALRGRSLPVQLKWPNDLILHGRKLGGLLCEVRQRGNTHRAIAGLGLNWRNPVPPGGINLQAWPQAIDSLETLAAIACAAILSGADQARDEPTWLDDYWQLLAHQHQTVAVQGQRGTIVGITAQGELRVRLQAPGAATEICCPPGSLRLGYDGAAKGQSPRAEV